MTTVEQLDGRDLETFARKVGDMRKGVGPRPDEPAHGPGAREVRFLAEIVDRLWRDFQMAPDKADRRLTRGVLEQVFERAQQKSGCMPTNPDYWKQQIFKAFDESKSQGQAIG